MDRKEADTNLARIIGLASSQSATHGNFLEHPIGQRVGNRILPIPKGIIRLDLDDPESLGIRASKTERSCHLNMKSRRIVSQISDHDQDD